MSITHDEHAVAGVLERALEERAVTGRRFFEHRAEEIARLCHRMADRFASSGRLLALGASPAARSDVRHVTVEFVHPVIVGKRALPAIGIVGESGHAARELELFAEPEDIVVLFGERTEGAETAVAAARSRGCLTVAFAPVGAEWELEPPTEDAFIAQEIVETTYHILWELVHVFFEHRGPLAGGEEQRVHDAGAASFLYPFLGAGEYDPIAVIADVTRSVLLKAEEVEDLRARTVEGSRRPLAAAAAALRSAFERGGRLLALGNGGSATDAMDVVADFVSPPPSRAWPARPAIDLTADTAVITALANDIGADAVFARQVIAHGREGDVLLALSTSGTSPSVLAALAEGRRRGLVTVAMVGYDGGLIAAEGLADHIVLAPSEHIPRIQEAHATAYHLLRELAEPGPPP